jgi:hypothetical protein
MRTASSGGRTAGKGENGFYFPGPLGYFTETVKGRFISFMSITTPSPGVFLCAIVGTGDRRQEARDAVGGVPYGDEAQELLQFFINGEYKR